MNEEWLKKQKQIGDDNRRKVDRQAEIIHELKANPSEQREKELFHELRLLGTNGVDDLEIAIRARRGQDQNPKPRPHAGRMRSY